MNKRTDKDKEKVLVTPNAPSIHYGTSDYFNMQVGGNKAWQSEVIKPASFIERWLCEQDKTTVQLIPYILLFNKKGQLFKYQRKGGGEGRLEGKWSIGVGGHINEEDCRYASHKGKEIGWDTVIEGAVREINEEMVLSREYVKKNLYFLGTIYTPDEPSDKNVPGPSVGEVHLGLVYTMQVPNGTRVREENHLINPTFEDKPETEYKYEYWSTMILDKLHMIKEG